MLIKKVMIVLFFIVTGCFLGILVAKVLTSELHASPALSIFAICIFIAASIGLSLIIIGKLNNSIADLPLTGPRQGDITAWMVPRDGPSKSGFPLNKDRLVVGRDVKNEILLNDDSVSREHVELVRMGDTFLIRDMQSKNGLFINNQRVQEQMLQDGDTIGIGDLTFFYRSTRKPEPEEAPPET